MSITSIVGISGLELPPAAETRSNKNISRLALTKAMVQAEGQRNRRENRGFRVSAAIPCPHAGRIAMEPSSGTLVLFERTS